MMMDRCHFQKMMSRMDGVGGADGEVRGVMPPPSSAAAWDRAIRVGQGRRARQRPGCSVSMFSWVEVGQR